MIEKALLKMLKREGLITENEYEKAIEEIKKIDLKKVV